MTNKTYLPPKALALFNHIHFLTQKHGYCYASNEYLADKLGLEISTVKSYLCRLKKFECFDIEHCGHGRRCRRIYVLTNYKDLVEKLKAKALVNEAFLSTPKKISVPYSTEESPKASTKKSTKHIEQKNHKEEKKILERYNDMPVDCEQSKQASRYNDFLNNEILNAFDKRGHRHTAEMLIEHGLETKQLTYILKWESLSIARKIAEMAYTAKFRREARNLAAVVYTKIKLKDTSQGIPQSKKLSTDGYSWMQEGFI